MGRGGVLKWLKEVLNLLRWLKVNGKQAGTVWNQDTLWKIMKGKQLFISSHLWDCIVWNKHFCVWHMSDEMCVVHIMCVLCTLTHTHTHTHTLTHTHTHTIPKISRTWDHQWLWSVVYTLSVFSAVSVLTQLQFISLREKCALCGCLLTCVDITKWASMESSQNLGMCQMGQLSVSFKLQCVIWFDSEQVCFFFVVVVIQV